MGGLRTEVDRLKFIIPDPYQAPVGYVPVVSTYVDERGLTQYTYTLAPNGGGGGSGTVTDFSAGDLSPLFTSSVATSTTTPDLTFTQIAQAAHKVFAGPTGGADANPTFRLLVAGDLPSGVVASPLTTKGDIWGFSSSDARIPVGSDGQILKADSSQALGVKWADAPSNDQQPGCNFTNGNLIITGTLKGRRTIKSACKITGWTVVGDPGVSGNASIAVGHSTQAAYGTITSLFTATLTGADHGSASGLTHALAAGDVIYFTGSGWALFTNVTITLELGPP